MDVTGQFTGPLLDTDNMRTLVAIADTGSFTRAAGIVARTPSAVSMQIKKLEETVGRTLFERDGRAVRLTVDGEALVSVARRMLMLNQEAMSRFRTDATEGTVRIGTPNDFGTRFLPNILSQFALIYPNVTVDVRLDMSEVVMKQLNQGELDLALVMSGVLDEPLTGEVVYTEQLVWLGRKGGCAYDRDPLPLAVSDQGCSWRDTALAALDAANRSYRVAYSSPHCAGQLAAVLADLAVAPWPPSLVTPDTVALGPDHGLPRLGSYHLALHRAPTLSTAGRELADVVLSSIRNDAVGTMLPMTA